MHVQPAVCPNLSHISNYVQCFVHYARMWCLKIDIIVIIIHQLFQLFWCDLWCVLHLLLPWSQQPWPNQGTTQALPPLAAQKVYRIVVTEHDKKIQKENLVVAEPAGYDIFMNLFNHQNGSCNIKFGTVDKIDFSYTVNGVASTLRTFGLSGPRKGPNLYSIPPPTPVASHTSAVPTNPQTGFHMDGQVTYSGQMQGTIIWMMEHMAHQFYWHLDAKHTAIANCQAHWAHACTEELITPNHTKKRCSKNRDWHIASSRATSPMASTSNQIIGIEEENQNMETDEFGHENSTFESNETLISPIGSIINHELIDTLISGIESSTPTSKPALTIITDN